jgi:hypothetical protein
MTHSWHAQSPTWSQPIPALLKATAQPQNIPAIRKPTAMTHDSHAETNALTKKHMLKTMFLTTTHASHSEIIVFDLKAFQPF